MAHPKMTQPQGLLPRALPGVHGVSFSQPVLPGLGLVRVGNEPFLLQGLEAGPQGSLEPSTTGLQPASEVLFYSRSLGEIRDF